MPEYRRAVARGGTFFLTLVTHNRRPLFADEENVSRLREALASVKRACPFDATAGVALPDHPHLLWTLHPGDSDLSARVGRFKLFFTRSLCSDQPMSQAVSHSRLKHRERGIWQRRFWEHTIRDDRDFEQHMAYIHYNPGKHGLTTCPHLWPFSSFERWVRRGAYGEDWCCTCSGRRPRAPEFQNLDGSAGE